MQHRNILAALTLSLLLAACGGGGGSAGPADVELAAAAEQSATSPATVDTPTTADTPAQAAQPGSAPVVDVTTPYAVPTMPEQRVPQPVADLGTPTQVLPDQRVPGLNPSINRMDQPAAPQYLAVPQPIEQRTPSAVPGMPAAGPIPVLPVAGQWKALAAKMGPTDVLRGAALSVASFAEKAAAARDAMVAGDRDTLVNAAVAMCRYDLAKERFHALAANDLQAANDAAHEMTGACQVNTFDSETDAALTQTATGPMAM